MPLDKIAEFEDDEWINNVTEDDLKEIELLDGNK